MRRAIALVIIVACSPSEHRAARERYNEGVTLLASGDFAGAEKALIDARNQAGYDGELRFRAAYDLGLAYAAHADKTKSGENADLAAALEQEQQAVSWFLDAQRLRSNDADTKDNLAIARARVAAIQDQLDKGQNKLEARLDAVIGEQRGVLDEARGAWQAIREAHGADPLAQQSALASLADKERGVIAEAGVIGDLAGEEIDTIGKKAEDKRSEEEKVRVVQLKNLDLYLMDGRTKIAEARKKLQDLDAQAGVERAEAALVALKRSREQLLDPITVMKMLARDQLELAQDTQTIGEHEHAGGLLGSGAAREALPAWLAPGPLGEREGGLRDRLEEIRARLDAGASTAAKDDKQQKLLERVKAAQPFVGEASDAMARARDALTGDKIEDAAKAERDVLIALARAIEQFADLKQTIELADATQHQIGALLAPEAAKQLAPADRASQTKDALAQNLARMPRIAELLADETKQLDQHASSPADPKADPKQVEAAKQQVEQMKAQLAQAETLRGDAAKALADLDAAIKTNKDPQPSAKLAQDKLDELRKLFFSVIEHLQELVREQGETRDQTAQADGEDDFTRAPKLPGISQREAEHGAMAKAITDALAKQADEAGKQPQGQQQGGIPPKSLAAAADEVRLAQGEMTNAGTTLGKASAPSSTQSFSLKPAVDSEAKAIEHLENALKLLQPPPKKNDKQDKQDQQDQQQQQKQQQPQQQQPQGGAGQRARDEDAQRQRQRARQGGNDPVDQDW